MPQIIINNPTDPVELNCSSCAYKQEYCRRIQRNLRSQQCERYRCIFPTDHGGVFAKDSGALMIRFIFAPNEQGRTAKYMEESAEAEDFVFNMLNPHS